MLENGVNIRVVQELMGHADVKTTEIYTRVMQKDMDTLQSPLDTLESRGRSSQNDAQRQVAAKIASCIRPAGPAALFAVQNTGTKGGKIKQPGAPAKGKRPAVPLFTASECRG